jgi:hypothetical protein
MKPRNLDLKLYTSIRWCGSNKRLNKNRGNICEEGEGKFQKQNSKFQIRTTYDLPLTTYDLCLTPFY